MNCPKCFIKIGEFLKKCLNTGKNALIAILGLLILFPKLIINLFNLGKNSICVLLGLIVSIPNWIKKMLKKIFRYGEHIWRRISDSFFAVLGACCAVIILVIALFFILSIIKIISPNFIHSLSLKYILSNPSPTALDAHATTSLNYLIAKGQIVSASDMYSNILEYYNTLISFLIGILGVFALVSWISLQAKAKHEAEKSVDAKLENKDFNCRLEHIIYEAVKVIYDARKDKFIDKVKDELVQYGKIKDEILTSKEFKELISNEVLKITEGNEEELTQLDGVENGD